MIMASRASRRIQTCFMRSGSLAGARSQRIISSTLSSRVEKHTGEKDEIVVESQEYSKSGFDSWAAETKGTAFSGNKDKTKPDEELVQAERESKEINQPSNPLTVSPANRDISTPFEIREEPTSSAQSKVAGQESKRTAAPKGKVLPRYDEKGDQVGFRGTGSYRTQNQEQPGPKFPSASRREGKEQWPERTERRKYVGSGR